MSLTLTYSLVIDDARRQIMEARKDLADSLGPVLEMATMEAVQSHLDTNYVGKPNALGGTPTGYWTGVRNSASADTKVTGTNATTTITLTGPGLRMKWTGGIIRPTGRVSSVTGKPVRFLAIPVDAASHGKVPAMFGKALERHGGGLFAKLGGRQIGGLLFILARHAKINPNKNILPPETVIRQRAGEALELLFTT